MKVPRSFRPTWSTTKSCGAASSTAGHRDDLLIQDTAWQGYEQIPQWIVDGYDTLFDEIDMQLGEHAAHLVAVPTGVGSLLQAALQHYRDPARRQQPAILAVEPVTAACVTASLAAGRRVSRRHLGTHHHGWAELWHRVRNRLARHPATGWMR